MRHMVDSWPRMATLGGVAAGTMLATLIGSDPAWAELIWQNGRLVDSRSARGQMDPQTYRALMRVLLTAGSTGLGFAIGWFLSPKAKEAQLVVLALLGLVALATVAFDTSFIGRSLALVLAIVGFCVGMGYWLSLIHI